MIRSANALRTATTRSARPGKVAKSPRKHQRGASSSHGEQDGTGQRTVDRETGQRSGFEVAGKEPKSPMSQVTFCRLPGSTRNMRSRGGPSTPPPTCTDRSPLPGGCNACQPGRPAQPSHRILRERIPQGDPKNGPDDCCRGNQRIGAIADFRRPEINRRKASTGRGRGKP
jgi:hypothetical protein